MVVVRWVVVEELVERWLGLGVHTKVRGRAASLWGRADEASNFGNSMARDYSNCWNCRLCQKWVQSTSQKRNWRLLVRRLLWVLRFCLVQSPIVPHLPASRMLIRLVRQDFVLLLRLRLWQGPSHFCARPHLNTRKLRNSLDLTTVMMGKNNQPYILYSIIKVLMGKHILTPFFRWRDYKN